MSLTQAHRVDFDVAQALPVTVSALAGIIAGKGARELSGVYEVHNGAVIGVSPVMDDGSFQMSSCRECWRHVRSADAACEACGPVGTEARWIFSLEIADATSSVSAMLYHGTTKLLHFLPKDRPAGHPLDSKEIQRMLREFRAPLWSLRCVLRAGAMRDMNTLEIKRMEPTISPEGGH